MTDIDVLYVISSVNHNHERNGFAVEATKMRENLRQRAISNRGNTSQTLLTSGVASSIIGGGQYSYIRVLHY